LNRPNPRVGLLSTGEEEGKGNDLVRQTAPLLKAADLNFIGNLEPKDLYAGMADVVVTDGFTGNVFLKTSEAVAALLVDWLRTEIRASPISAAGGWLARPAFRRVSRLLDPSEYGAVPLLGVDGLVFIGHGRSTDRALVNAIRVAREAVSAGLLQALRQRLAVALAGVAG
ncbi:MAG TPA: phosphate acyltransferase, partial [Anaerolineales bacterium]